MNERRTLDGAEFSSNILAAHQRMRMLVLAIAPRCTEVDDVIQNACSAMWSKIDEFDCSRNFDNWALTFVRFQTLAWLKRNSRDRLLLSSDTIEQFCTSLGHGSKFDRERTDALELCLAGLSDDDQELLALRFVEGVSVAEIAKRQSNNGKQRARTADALYKQFAKLKAALLQCVESRLKEATS